VQAAGLVLVELARRPQRVDARPPERLVDVDVPHAGERALVEERSLDRRAAAGETGGKRACGERARERLRAEASCEVRLELAGLDEQPRAEPADVAVGDVRSVV
jgi:hypothetical protein